MRKTSDTFKDLYSFSMGWRRWMGIGYPHPSLRPKDTIDTLLGYLKRNRYTFR
jgi:hypothetical protein